jgi:hypothetical protein
MAPSIPIRYLDNPNLQGQLTLLILQLQMEAQYRREIAQARRQNYGKAKEIYSARNKWSKIVAKPTTGIGSTASYNPCSCYPAGTTYNSLNNFCVCPQGTYCFGFINPICFIPR